MGTIIGDGITFDDVLLFPQYSEVTPNMVDLTTHLTKKIKLNIPMMSAGLAMVTEHRMACLLYTSYRGGKTGRSEKIQNEFLYNLQFSEKYIDFRKTT